MKAHFTIWRQRIAELLKSVSNDLGAVFLGIAVVFFTRAFPSAYLDNVDGVMFAASAALCVTGLAMRLYSRRGDPE